LLIDIVNNSKSYSIIPEALADNTDKNNILIMNIADCEVNMNIVLANDANRMKSPAIKFLEEYLINFFSTYTHVPRTITKPINIK
jgi:hypothetical protein